jgi:hypothetical protein
MWWYQQPRYIEQELSPLRYTKFKSSISLIHALVSATLVGGVMKVAFEMVYFHVQTPPSHVKKRSEVSEVKAGNVRSKWSHVTPK